MRTLAALFVLTALLPGALFAQSSAPAAALRLPQADVAATIGWLHSDLSWLPGDNTGWTHGQATLGLRGGYYWTEHLKTEGALERSSTVKAWSYEEIRLPGGTPGFRGGTHEIGYTRASIGQLYQFGHNAWVHAAVGAGLSVIARDVHGEFHSVSYYDGTQHVAEPPPGGTDTVHTDVGGYATAVLKAYVSRRAFVRGDVQVDFRSALDHVVFRAGFGIDF